MFLKKCLTHFGRHKNYMATEIWVNIGRGIGLLPGGTKPLQEQVFYILLFYREQQ